MTDAEIAALRAAGSKTIDGGSLIFTWEDERKHLQAISGTLAGWQRLLSLLDRLARAEAENADMRISVVAFCGPWAVQHAAEHGLPKGHLFSTHYDILQRAGARMDDFTRHEGGAA